MFDYGARFYDPVIGRFNTVDRFAEKYSDFTPYQYAANNPAKNIDINGDSIRVNYNGQDILYHNGGYYNNDGSAYKGDGTKFNKDGSVKGYKGFLGEALSGLNKIAQGEEGSNLISSLVSSSSTITIAQGDDNGYNPLNFTNSTNGVGSDGLVKWNATRTDGGPDAFENTSRPSFIGLAHELGHGLDGSHGNLDYNVWFNITTSTGESPVRNAEKYAAYWENKIRAESGVSLRTHYQPGYGNISRLIINGAESIQPGHYNFLNNIARPDYQKLLRGF